MKAEATSTCQTCGTRVPAGLDSCPVCALLRAGGQDCATAEALNPVSDSEREVAETEAASPCPHAPQIVRRFENYEVMLDQAGKPIELGRGAMGITYKAFDVDLRFPVTLKIISEKYVGDESARLRFLREARAAAKVRHPNVASVFHLGRSGGEYFYVMEFVEGETLESIIKRSGRLEVKLALELTSQVAAGLEAVHEQKLVHRDIKPPNIMVRLKDDGRVTAKIIDLGLAKGISEPGTQSAISTPRAFAGTPEFASPEQFAGLAVDIRSDLYSLGVTLWEMLVGQAPFRGPPTEVMRQQQHSLLPIDQLKRLPRPEEQKNIGQRPTTNLEAYDLYLQAKELVGNWRFRAQGWANDLPKAIKLLEEATQKDPKFTLAYCVLARAHDDLYFYAFDKTHKTPERRALAEAAVNEALRLEPDSPEAHLAAAYHLVDAYRNDERTKVQVELAQRALPNSPEAFWLAGRIDSRAGRLEEATNAMEKAYSLDPRNPDIIYELAGTYSARGRYREAEQVNGRLNELEPDSPESKYVKAWAEFSRTGDLTRFRAVLDSMPSTEPYLSGRFWFALSIRDWTTAKLLLDKNPDEDLLYADVVKVAIPRQCGEIYLAALQGKHPTMENGFGAARNQLAQRFEAHPDDVQLLSILGEVDALLGRKQEAIEEATRAVELRPISQDAWEGPFILGELATVYIWTNEPDQAFRVLDILAKRPGFLGNRASFKANPWVDPIRNDPGFDKLAEQLPEHQ